MVSPWANESEILLPPVTPLASSKASWAIPAQGWDPRDGIHGVSPWWAAGWAWPGQGWDWWMVLHHPLSPPRPTWNRILFKLPFIFLWPWSIKMNTTVVRIDCNFFSFSSMKEHFWHKNNIQGVLVLLFNCSSSDQLSCSLCPEVLILQAIKKSFVILDEVCCLLARVYHWNSLRFSFRDKLSVTQRWSFIFQVLPNPPDKSAVVISLNTD